MENTCQPVSVFDLEIWQVVGSDDATLVRCLVSGAELGIIGQFP